MKHPRALDAPTCNLLRLLSSLALIAALPGNTLAQVRLAPPDSLDGFIQEQMVERQIPGLALAISRNGEVVVARGYGVADVQNGAPVTAETRFDLASITKQFTAAGIMLLVEEGRIELDASIRTYLPEIPESRAGITVRHLLTHTSGLPSAGFLRNPPIDISNDMWYPASLEDPVAFPPGDGFLYSDRNYRLLGLITERVSGTAWREFMPTRVFLPLGMTDTYLVDRWSIFENEARNYDLRDGEVVNARRVYHVETPSHNGVSSNVLDLVEWDAALYSDRLLSQESRHEMWSRVRLSSGARHPYGFGWALYHRAGRPVHVHGGITGTMVLRFPQDTLAVIVLTNLGAGSNMGEIAWDIAGMMIPELVDGLAIDPAELEGYVGEYLNERGLIARVLTQDGRLYIVPPRADRPVELVYQGGTRFAFRYSDAAVEFIPDRGASASGMLIYPQDYSAPPIRFVRR